MVERVAVGPPGSYDPGGVLRHPGAESLRSTDVNDPAAAAGARAASRAFVEVYRAYLGPVYRYLYHRTGNREDAEDLAATVFADALAAWPEYRERGSVAPWLFTIVRRRLADHWRHYRATVALEDVLPALTGPDDASEAALHHDRLRRLGRLLAELSEADRDFVGLRFAAGLSYREMAALLGRSEDAVKMAMHRLLRRMELAWEVHDDDGC